MKQHATKIRIMQHINEALRLIDERKTEGKWGEKLVVVGNKLSVIAKQINQSRKGAIGLADIHKQQAGRAFAFQVNQRKQSQLNILDDLDDMVEKGYQKIIEALIKAEKKSPTDHSDKSVTELLNTLAGHITKYDKMLSQLEALTAKMAKSQSSSHSLVITQVQRDVNQLKTQPAMQGPSLLLSIAILIRLASLFFANKK